jgi:MFS family permease
LISKSNAAAGTFVGLLLTYLSFSLTFLVRPFGGFFFSHIGDKIGRKNTLVLTLSLMGVSTFLIGLLPGYDVLGVWATVLFALLRIVQGLGISGEWGGALLLLAHNEISGLSKPALGHRTRNALQCAENLLQARR